MRRLAGLVLSCAAALSAAAVAEASVEAVPVVHTFKPAGLGLSFTLPSDWAGTGGTGASGARFEGFGPASVATLSVFTHATAQSLSELRPQLLATAREQTTLADAHASLVTHTTKVGASVPALQISVRYHGPWANGVGNITVLMYFFVQGGVLYEFDYTAVAPWTARYLPKIAASAKSIHFLQIA
jgi:hypothetical protein